MNDRVTVVIAEDERAAREHLAAILDSFGVHVLASCSDGKELLDAVSRSRPDVLFVDIEMPELDGASAVASLPRSRRPVIVFVTAHDEFAVRAFDLEAADYVLKPFGRERIARALERAQRGRMSSPSRPPTRGERFLVLTAGKIIVIEENEIDYLEAAGNYVRLHTTDRDSLVRETLRAVEERLDAHQYARTHRSFVVRLSKIQLVRRGADSVAILDDGREIPVSRTYRDALIARLGQGSGE